MTTYALYVLVTFLLNNFHDELQTPFDVFERFFEYFADFDWSARILTIYGPVTFQHQMGTKRSFEQLALDERASDPVLKDKPLLVKPS
mmetsp:Transcript_573/g.931  ORF Transcript_573/g.931 Transcript_573/m.931 type:complete len:88 (+) Transcript_573:656-919(+)|eukprot:CAMPEP_0170452508 /NCGR_PEP_ID=MMETSP0123-20130129/1380_1 /TAXON_ID=182087 /ORGANISM="Favella ehrenbergii, Strain Fehren 1" /LENGTH=87 /DNA_ID=CAMNT_0010714531 /DNA_START=641 /DNA_END=904 /DNA_ORIENTATION=-